jgi:hypothetical protein
MSYCLFILGNGRKGYLERTIASWEANLVENPEHRIIFDDSGDAEYVEWLNETYGDRYQIIAIGEESMGQKYAIQFIFDTLKELDIDYFVQLEEDWMLFRPINISEIIEVMEQNKNVVQMRIPRTIWYADYHVLDINAGSLLNYHLNLAGTNNRKHSKWYSWRGDFYFWSHNPNVFSKSVLENSYDIKTVSDHEKDFGRSLMENKNAVVGFWAENPYDAYITHIGIRNDKLLKQLPPLNKEKR